MRTIIFVNGVIPDYRRLQGWLHAEDRLIAADGGTYHCLAMGHLPHVVVGDLDSVEPALVEKLAGLGVEIERYPVAKNETDLELALERAIRDGATLILIMGALGGRLDQSIANVLLMAQRAWPVPIRLVDAQEIASVIRGGEQMTLTAAPGSTVSLLPLSDVVTGITYTGLLYPLVNHTLHLGSTRAVSNEVVADGATVRIDSGIALIIQTLETQPTHNELRPV